VDVFTPTPRNWKELERPVDVSPQLLETRESWKVRGRFNPCTSNCLSVLEADTHQETKRALASIQA